METKRTYPHITVTQGLAGWFAVMLVDTDGFVEPEESGIGRYKMQTDAISEGKYWAKCEELPFYEPAIDDQPARQDVIQQLLEIIPDAKVINLENIYGPPT
jgi:hypothetical protein